MVLVCVSNIIDLLKTIHYNIHLFYNINIKPFHTGSTTWKQRGGHEYNSRVLTGRMPRQNGRGKIVVTLMEERGVNKYVSMLG